MGYSHTIALVTGANRGLGASFVEALIQRGAKKVYACARNADSLHDICDAHPGKVFPLELDVTKDDQVQAAADQANDVTLLINNAGVLESRGLMEAGNLDALQHEMDVNVYGVARMSLAFASILKSNGGGDMLNMLSVASLHCFAPFGTYSASKAAAMSLTQCQRYELRDQGTRVFGAYAGFIDTGMIDYVDSDKAAPEDVVTACLDGINAGTLDIDTDERAKAVRALLQEDAQTIQDAYWQRADDFRQAYPVTNVDNNTK